MVYFVSDLDPSGLDLQRSWEEALRNFGVPVMNRLPNGRPGDFVRIGLTPAQVRANRLQRLAIAVKESDSRSKRYIEQFGNLCSGGRHPASRRHTPNARPAHPLVARPRAVGPPRRRDRACLQAVVMALLDAVRGVAARSPARYACRCLVTKARASHRHAVVP